MTVLTAAPLTAGGLRRRVRGLDPVTAALGCGLLVLVLLAVFAPLVAPYPPNQGDILSANLSPSAAHWLGTDETGRDIVSRLLFGTRLSLLGPALIILFASVLGVTMAVAAVWVGGWFDLVVARALDLLFAFPGLLVAILAVAVLGPGLFAPVVALALAYTPYIARVVRTVALRERNLAYIESCQVVGLSGLRICVRHLVPNVFPIVRAQVTIAFGAALVDLAAVSYLGLGVQPPQSEWGLMVSNGQSSFLNGYPAESLSACVMIILVVVAVNVMGERMAARAEAAV